MGRYSRELQVNSYYPRSINVHPKHGLQALLHCAAIIMQRGLVAAPLVLSGAMYYLLSVSLTLCDMSYGKALSLTRKK